MGFLLLGAPRSSAHVVYAREGLRQLVQGADLIVVARFESGPLLWRAPDGSDHQEYFRVRIEQVLKGERPGDRVDFVPTAEGFPGYASGDRALLFLVRSESSPALRPLAQRFRWFSIQGAGQEWKVGSEREGRIAAVREYLRLSSLPNSTLRERYPALLLRELRGPDVRLREDAFGELVRLLALPGFFRSRSALDPFAALVADPTLPTSFRVSLALALDGRFAFSAADALRPMTQEPLAPRDRSALVRACGRLHDAGLSAWLAQELRAPEARRRREAATALAYPWHASQLPVLVSAVDDEDPEVARSALRALAELGTPGAREALRRLSGNAEHPLHARAAAELRRIGAD